MDFDDLSKFAQNMEFGLLILHEQIILFETLLHMTYEIIL